MTTLWGGRFHQLDGRPIGADPLRRLIDGDDAVVVLRGLLPEETFTVNRTRLMPLFGRALTTRYVNGSLTIIGPYLAKYLSRPDEYFQAAAEARALTDSVGFDLGQRVREALRQTFGLSSFVPAMEGDGRRYSDSNVRIYADGIDTPLHNDNILRDANSTGLVLAGLKHQLSCVVCVQECNEGGELQMYRRAWQPADEQYKIQGGLGYDEAVVAGAPCYEFKPRTGDVYLLNPTYYHAIKRVSGADRVTLGFFFGFFADDLADATLWI